VVGDVGFVAGGFGDGGLRCGRCGDTFPRNTNAPLAVLASTFTLGLLTSSFLSGAFASATLSSSFSRGFPSSCFAPVSCWLVLVVAETVGLSTVLLATTDDGKTLLLA
jgi:hypothetical protein